MGELYQRMARDLKLRNLAEGTQQQYLRCCCRFVRFHMKPPTELGESALKEYLAHLQLRGAGPEMLKMHVAALKFLYGVTLDRAKVADRLPWPKVPHKKPDILSGTEVEKLLRAAAKASLVSAMALTTAYGAGLRISEVCRLRAEDIDSRRGLIHVRLGKGNKDRYVMLSPRLLGCSARVLGTGAAFRRVAFPRKKLRPTAVPQRGEQSVGGRAEGGIDEEARHRAFTAARVRDAPSGDGQ